MLFLVFVKIWDFYNWLTIGIGISIVKGFSKYWYSHLSKGTSGLKQKCTQTLTSFLGTVFQALSHDVIHFVPRVSSKTLKWKFLIGC